MAPYSGGCLCGALRYRVTAEPLTLYACHCTDCQRRTGTAFAPDAVKFEKMAGDFAVLIRLWSERRQSPA